MSGDVDGAAGGPVEAEAGGRLRSPLLSRILVTWGELTAVGFAGAVLAAVASGPPRLVVYLATTLVSVAVLLYNVDRLVRTRLAGRA